MEVVSFFIFLFFFTLFSSLPLFLLHFSFRMIPQIHFLSFLLHVQVLDKSILSKYTVY